MSDKYLEIQLAQAKETISALEARIEEADGQEPVGHLSEDGYFMAAQKDTPRYKDFYVRPPITSQREIELLVVIEQMREAMNKYIHSDDTDTSDLEDAIALTPSLSAIKEHDARVLEEAADKFETSNFKQGYGGSTVANIKMDLRKMAAELRQP